MSVPYSRLEPQGGGMVGIGRSTEVTRDELKFNKFIEKLRNKFSQIFDDALKIQLSLKGICTVEEWEEFKEYITYDFKKDNNFTEMREAELLRERLSTLNMVDPYVGRYFSAEWVKKNVLRLSEEEIQVIDKQIESEPERVDPNQPQEQVDSEQYQPEDNTVDNTSNESQTPELDNAVDRYSNVLNKK
jgi:hypothetical protein